MTLGERNSRPSAPRSLADALRQRDDGGIARLLRARPDLLHPVASDITALAARATTGPSVSRCLDTLSALDLHVLGVVTRTGDAMSVEDIRAGVRADIDGIDDETVDQVITRLIDLALLWGTPDGLRAIHSLHDALEPTAPATWPVPALHAVGTLDPEQADGMGAAHVLELLAHVRELGDAWSFDPPGVMRSGGLALRDIAQATRTIGAELPTTSLIIEVAVHAGLIADDGEIEPSWVPTDRYDRWLQSTAAEQWLALAQSWLTLPRLPSMATDKTNVLSSDLERRAVPSTRQGVLMLLAEAEPGMSSDEASIRAVLDARRPRRIGRLRDEVITATLIEGALLGVLVGGALTTAGRALVDGQAKAAARAMAAALPSPVDHVLIQADLTMIAPGPLAPGPARTLRLLADVESRGHATVFRITEASIQRALEAGWDADRITTELTAISTTGVPQALAYLISDASRRHGAVRVGIASSYIRCDDPAVLATMLADRRLASLRLTQAGDAIVSQTAPHELMAALRAAGYAPAAESPTGEVVSAPRAERRTAAPRQAAVSTRRADPERLIDAAIRTLRSGDRPQASQPEPPELEPASSATIVARLRSAIEHTEPLWIAYAESDGTTVEQIIDPIRIGGGSITAFDHRTEQVRTFAVARISSVASA